VSYRVLGAGCFITYCSYCEQYKTDKSGFEYRKGKKIYFFIRFGRALDTARFL